VPDGVQEQTLFKVDDFSVEIVQRRLHHVYYLTVYKYLFVIAAAITATKFFRSVSRRVLTFSLDQPVPLR